MSQELRDIYYSEEEWEERIDENNSFIMNIKMEPKIILKGDGLDL